MRCFFTRIQFSRRSDEKSDSKSMIRKDNILYCNHHRSFLIICCSHEKYINISANSLIYALTENSQNSRLNSRNTDRVSHPYKNMHASLSLYPVYVDIRWMRLYIKVGFNRHSGFSGKEDWKCWIWVAFDQGLWMILTFDIHIGPCTGTHWSHLMTKPPNWHVCPAKIRISLGIRPVWSESSPPHEENLGP